MLSKKTIVPIGFYAYNYFLKESKNKSDPEFKLISAFLQRVLSFNKNGDSITNPPLLVLERVNIIDLLDK